MAESIVFGVASEVLKKIGSLIGREVSLLWDLESDLRRLEGTMSTIKAVLLDAETKQTQDHQLRDWLGKLKDVFYDAEDVLDEFEFQASRREVVRQQGSSIRKVCHCFSSSNPVAFSSEMGLKIKEIRQRLDQIADDRQKFSLIESEVDVRHVIPKARETYPFLGASYVIGREDDKKTIISFLMQPTGVDVSVIPIVGIGGSGKTTLTKMVYNDETVDDLFPLKLWVYVSDDFDVIRMMKEIIYSKTRDKACLKLRADETTKCLEAILTGQKFLLVLDDVWNENPMKWMDLKTILLNGINGSKIIVSTRSKRVAEIMGTVYPHIIQGLSPDDCLSLFKKCAFKDEEGKNFPKLIQIGKEIVGKCKGVPLAVRTLGSLLFANTDEDEWLRIKTSDIWQLEQEDEDILPVLKLSYDRLPSHLKQCFLYLCLFPKDYTYDAEYTVQYWIAFGLLATSNENEELEDVGLRYIKQLTSRCFIQDFYEHSFCYEFRLHDLMHDLAISVAQTECSMINFKTQKADGRVRHFSIDDTDFCGKQVPECLVNNSRVRTVIFPGKKYEPISVSFINTCISKFKFLRLLYLNSILFEVLSDSVGTLIHLRCLDLSWNYLLKKLPGSICQLQNLQTLRLRACAGIKKLPRKIRKMTSLRYVEITTQEWHLRENGIGRLSSLQYLFLYGCTNLVSLFGNMQGLTGLRTLYIKSCSLISLPHSLKYLPKLERLVLWTCQALDLKMEPQEEDRHLSLRLRRFVAYDLPSLQDLPQVILQGSADTLQFMLIEKCHKLEALPGWMQNLTSLRTLRITDCSSLSYLPEGVRRLTTLEELKIQDCPALSG